MRQEEEKIYVNYHKFITKTLLDDICKVFKSFCDKQDIPDELLRKNPSQYIVAYIGEVLSQINEEILKRKYNEGHIITKTLSLFDVDEVFILDKTGNFHAILWPKPIPGFPKIDEFKDELNVIFIRDLVDSMTEYFYFNLDECIRKVITSLENYFIYFKLKPKNKKSFLQKIFAKNKKPGSKFRNQVDQFIIDKYYAYKERDLKILRENIISIYNLRNKIVHDELRIKLSNTMVCKKAIGTLLYIYHSSFATKELGGEYIISLDMQFKMIADDLLGNNLDNFAKAEKMKKKVEIIHNEDEHDESSFRSLKITKKELKNARKIKKHIAKGFHGRDKKHPEAIRHHVTRIIN